MVHFVDTFPAYAASTNGVKQFMKNLPPLHELRGFAVQLNGDIRSSAAGAVAYKVKPNDLSAVGGANDSLTIFNSFFARFYAKINEQTNALNVKPVDLINYFGGQHGWHMLGCDLVDGDSINGSAGAKIKFRMEALFDFTHSGMETPNKFCPGTEQAGLNGGWEISYDTGASASGATIVLVNGSVIVNVLSIRLIADIAPTDVPHVAPTWFMREDQEATENNERKGAFIEWLVYTNDLPQTLEAAITTVNIKSDGIDLVKQQTPQELANAFARQTSPRDGEVPYCVERNSSPLRWQHHRIKSEERELQATLVARNINFQGSTATRTIRRHFVTPQRESAAICQAVMAMYGDRSSWETKPVRFPVARAKDQILDDVFGSRRVA